MEDLIGRANTLKSIKSEAELKSQEEERQRQAELDILIKQSDERASQFIEILREHEIPQVDVVYTDSIPDASGDLGRGNYEKHLVGRGWIVKDYEPSTDPDSSGGSPGIVLLEDLRSYRLGWDSKSPLPDGIEANGEYVSIGCAARGSYSQFPKIIDKSLLPACYADRGRYCGLDHLGEALIRYGIV